MFLQFHFSDDWLYLGLALLYSFAFKFAWGSFLLKFLFVKRSFGGLSLLVYIGRVWTSTRWWSYIEIDEMKSRKVNLKLILSSCIGSFSLQNPEIYFFPDIYDYRKLHEIYCTVFEHGTTWRKRRKTSAYSNKKYEKCLKKVYIWLDSSKNSFFINFFYINLNNEYN